MSRVLVLVVNWNGWADTIECLESVFRLRHPAFRVFVCDNGSTDGSLERLLAWSRGELDLWLPPSAALRRFSSPPVPKPIRSVVHAPRRAESGGDPGEDVPLVLVRSETNLGFAGANNVGLRYALSRNDVDYVWLLNNDTVVDEGALGQLLRRMEQDPRIGMCGSTIALYHEPDRLWARGGATYNRWLAYPRCIGLGRPVGEPAAAQDVERAMAYVAGASMLVSLAFLRDVGLLCEDYFLYFEELDWAARARGRYRMGYAPQSLVYHKVGRATALLWKGAGGRGRQRDLVYRNMLLFTRRFHPAAVPTVRLSIGAQRLVAGLRDALLGRAGAGA